MSAGLPHSLSPKDLRAALSTLEEIQDLLDRIESRRLYDEETRGFIEAIPLHQLAGEVDGKLHTLYSEGRLAVLLQLVGGSRPIQQLLDWKRRVTKAAWETRAIDRLAPQRWGREFAVAKQGVAGWRQQIRSKWCNNEVFVVHGHDASTAKRVTDWIAGRGLRPVVLAKQPNEGRTIIEKFEFYASRALYAVVLLTPDDIAAAKRMPKRRRRRARQNVMLELGFFMARLGRERVCALLKPHVELPSNYDGVAYVSMDSKGSWMRQLERELERAEVLPPFSPVV